MDKKTEIEVNLLIDAIYRTYGYDFRHYQLNTLKNRFKQYATNQGLNQISELIPKVVHDRNFFYDLLPNLSVTVTQMFRDPEFYSDLRKSVIPELKTYPYINIWHAGCATGQEVYSMAVILKEEEMLHRSHIYATDINEKSISIGKTGVFPLPEMKKNTSNYNLTGGKGSLTDFYHLQYKLVKMDKELIDKITFSRHNLVTDGAFTEAHVIVCKNVLIYFNRDLQNRVLQLLTDSLSHSGFLCLGHNESLDFSKVESLYDVVNRESSIYQKKLISA